MSNAAISFVKGPKGFFADRSIGYGRKAIDIRYVPDRSQKAPIEGCYYDFEISHEIPHPTRKGMKTCFVKFINREANEARYREDMEIAEREQENIRQLKNELAQVRKEIISQWIGEYEKVPGLVRNFFIIGKPHNMADEPSYSPAITQLISNFNKWKFDFQYAMEWKTDFHNIVKFMEEKTESYNKHHKDAEIQLKGLNTQITEIDEFVKKYPKKRIFIKSVETEVDIFYDYVEKKLAFIKKIYGSYTHYYAESDDGYRAAGSCEINGWYNQKFFVNDDEESEILPLFKDVIDLIETKKELNDRLNREREEWVLKRKTEGQSIAERLLPPELLKKAMSHIY